MLKNNSELGSLLSSARDRLVLFAMSEWLTLVPDLVKGVEGILQGLEPEMMLGNAFPAVPSGSSLFGAPEPVLSIPPSPEASCVVPSPSSNTLSLPGAPEPVHSVSPSPAASCVVPPPLSSTPSSVSGHVNPPSHDSDIASCPCCPLPWILF